MVDRKFLDATAAHRLLAAHSVGNCPGSEEADLHALLDTMLRPGDDSRSMPRTAAAPTVPPLH